MTAPEAEALEKAVRRAALRWCGEKDRETFLGDAEYFRVNWQSLPGLRVFVERELLEEST